MTVHSLPIRMIWAGIAGGCLLASSISPVFSQPDAAPPPAAPPPAPTIPLQPTPPFTSHPLDRSLLDFVTGAPIGRMFKSAKTNPLLREPFAGQPLNSPKGLAAAIKANQLDAKNRIKAVRFLGTVDCIRFEESQDMLILSMQADPCEEVRYESVLAIQNQLARPRAGHPGKKTQRRYDFCPGCCNQKVMNALSKVAYESTDPAGCSVEPSQRVREAAAKALQVCCDCIAEAGATPDGSMIPPPIPDQQLKEAQPLPEGKEATPIPPKTGRAPVGLPAATSALQPGAGSPRSPETADDSIPLAPEEITAPEAKSAKVSAAGGGETVTADAESAAGSKAAGTVQTAGQASPEAAAGSAATIAAETAVTEPSAPAPVAEPLPPLAALKGYCIVALKEKKFVKANRELSSVHEGRTYLFSSEEAKSRFDQSPAEFAPAQGGIDLVHLSQTGEKSEGSIFFKHDGRFLLFQSEQNIEKFMADPEAFLIAE